MPMIWNQRTSDTANTRDLGEGDSLKMIPLWSVILATLVFLGVVYIFNSAPPPHRRPGSLPMHIIFTYTTGTALASYILLVGYVSRDVRRRNMPAALWMLIAVVMPAGLGCVFHAASADHDALPELHHRTHRQRPLLPAVPVPGRASLRTVLPRRSDYRRLLHSMRTRSGRGWGSRQAPRV
jgi:hypothetical protein